MKNRIYQLEGEDSDLALFEIPSQIQAVQECFDEAFAAVSESDDLLSAAADWLEENYGITRIYIQDYVFTDKL